VVQVVRDLRSKQSRAEKAEAKTGKYVAPKVSFKELKQVFRDLTDQTIRIRLRDKCECIAVKVNLTDCCFGFFWNNGVQWSLNECYLNQKRSPAASAHAGFNTESGNTYMHCLPRLFRPTATCCLLWILLLNIKHIATQ